MRLMHRAAAVLAAAFILGLTTTTASAQVVAEGNGVIIKAAPGGYSISRDGGRTWAPYVVRRPAKPVPLKPVVVPPPPAKPLVACDFYQCGGRIIAVPAGTPGPGGLQVGTGMIDGRAVDPKTNVLR